MLLERVVRRSKLIGRVEKRQVRGTSIDLMRSRGREGGGVGCSGGANLEIVCVPVMRNDEERKKKEDEEE